MDSAPRSSLQGRGGRDIDFLNAQCLHEHFPYPRMSLVRGWHGLLLTRRLKMQRRPIQFGPLMFSLAVCRYREDLPEARSAALRAARAAHRVRGR